MGRDSAIQWTDHTFNPWWGCTHAPGDPQCLNCYAEALAKRVGVGWGSSPRRMFGDKHWHEPEVWNAAAARAGVRHKVFCASMCDVFESSTSGEVAEARVRLWDTIRRCDKLDWLLLTKRPQNVELMVPKAWMKEAWPANLWMGTSAGTQAVLDHRGRILLRIPAPVRFVSGEPLLGPLSFRNGPENRWGMDDSHDGFWDPHVPFDWVILGGESGPRARAMYVQWMRGVIAEIDDHNMCERFSNRVAVFVKQMGAFLTVPPSKTAEFVKLGGVYSGEAHSGEAGWYARIKLADKAGRNPDEWPTDLRMREFPMPQSEDGRGPA